MQIDKFVRRAQKFVGDSTPVDTVTVIQQRPPIAIAAGFVAFVVVALILNLLGLGNPILIGAVGGAALAVAMTSLTKTYYLAGVGNEAQLLRLATWTGQPEALEKTLPRPIDATIAKGLINKSVKIDGEKYILSRMFESEFGALTSATA